MLITWILLFGICSSPPSGASVLVPASPVVIAGLSVAAGVASGCVAVTSPLSSLSSMYCIYLPSRISVNEQTLLLT